MLAFRDGDAWTPWAGQQRPRGDGILCTLPANAAAVLSEDELADFGLYAIADAAPAPAGTRIVATVLADDAGRPRWTHQTAVIPLAEAQAERLAALAERRWQAETAGITVAGIPVSTDRESQGLITGAALAATLDGDYAVTWKTPGGAFVTLTAPQILAVAQGVRAHVQACFDREAVLAAVIAAAADLAALDAVDIESEWPEI